MKQKTKKSIEHIDSYSKFKKAIRYEIPIVSIAYDKVWNSGGMRITPEDLLKGIKNIKSLGSSKCKDAYDKFIKDLRKIYVEQELWNYTMNGESELKYNQYPAPSRDYYNDNLTDWMDNRFGLLSN